MNPADLEGLITEDVAERLAWWAANTTGDILEVGSYKGKSACYLAIGAGPGRTVYAVDVWDAGRVPAADKFGFDTAYDDFVRQVALMGLSDRVVPVCGYSLDVAAGWDRPLGLVYIDGDHGFDAALADLHAWAPHCAGPILVDDYDVTKNPDVAPAVRTFCEQSGRTHTVEASGRLAVIR